MAHPSHLARKPRTVDHVSAASVPVAALTAWQTLFEAGRVSRARRVLVHGAGGSVGGFAVQFAKHAGAYVIAAANAQDSNYVSGLGADVVLDYGAGPFEKGTTEVDLVLDVIGGEMQERSLRLLGRGGILVSTVGISVSSDEADARGIETKAFFVRPDSAQLREQPTDCSHLFGQELEHVIQREDAYETARPVHDRRPADTLSRPCTKRPKPRPESLPRTRCASAA
ncbi:MAG: NADP-dependent oxidoreductase [Deltaproteobacteria bacterium]|nr:NADP-dependent oxidoreductase [Deltaproteobacteria bacterium]